MGRKKLRDKAPKADHVLTYIIREVADTSCWRLKDLAGGDVRSAIFDGWTHMMWHICHMVAGSVATGNPGCARTCVSGPLTQSSPTR